MESASDQSRTGQLLAVLAGLTIAAALIAGLVVATRGGGGARAGDGMDLPADPFEMNGYQFAGALGGSTVPNAPTDVAVGPDGTTFVADAGASRVLVFNQDGELVEGWGPDGSGRSAIIDEPSGLALDGDGNLYVLSYSNARVEKLGPAGQSLDRWSVRQGPVETSFPPLGIAINSQGNIYVAGDGIKVFDPSGKLVNSWNIAEVQYRAIAIDSQDRTYAMTNADLRIFSPDGEAITTWPRRQYAGPTGASNTLASLTIDTDDNIHVVNFGSGSDQQTGVVTLDTDGETLAEWTVDIRFAPRGAAGQFPGSPGVDQDDNLYIPDSSRQRVVKLSPNGEIVAAIGEHDRDRFAGLTSITTDQDGNLYAVDPVRERVLKFGPDGELTNAFEMNREGPLPFMPPETPDITVGPEGFIYVTDPSGSTILRYDPAGKLVNQWGGIGFEDEEIMFPYAIAIDSQQRLYIIDDSATVKIFSTDGEYIGVLSNTLEPLAQQLADIAIIGDRVYVPTQEGGAIKQFDLDGNQTNSITSRPDGIPNSLAADGNGNVYLPISVPPAGRDTPFISHFIKIGPDGEVLANAEIGPRNGLIYTTVGVGGALYITDPLTKHILTYEPITQ